MEAAIVLSLKNRLKQYAAVEAAVECDTLGLLEGRFRYSRWKVPYGCVVRIRKGKKPFKPVADGINTRACMVICMYTVPERQPRCAALICMQALESKASSKT
jgi:hypothetical protein